MSMHIISPGMLTTVQDLGRCGYMASGFQQSGAMGSPLPPRQQTSWSITARGTECSK